MTIKDFMHWSLLFHASGGQTFDKIFLKIQNDEEHRTCGYNGNRIVYGLFRDLHLSEIHVSAAMVFEPFQIFDVLVNPGQIGRHRNVIVSVQQGVKRIVPIEEHNRNPRNDNRRPNGKELSVLGSSVNSCRLEQCRRQIGKENF